MNINLPFYDNSPYSDAMDGIGISIPIIIKQIGLLIEPEFDYFTHGYQTKTPNVIGDYTENYTRDITNYKFSIGILKYIQKDKLKLYAGLRLGTNKYVLSHTSDDADYENKNYDVTHSYFYYSPVMGAEYLLNDHFSFGTECILNDYQFNERNQYTDDSDQKSYLKYYNNVFTIFKYVSNIVLQQYFFIFNFLNIFS